MVPFAFHMCVKNSNASVCVLLGKKKFASRQAGALEVSAGCLNPTRSHYATGRTNFKVGTFRFCMQQ